MPYIPSKDRKRLGKTTQYSEATIDNSGQLNYMITQLINVYLEEAGSSYSAYNDVVGALECCKLEFYRRMVVPYEITKCKENGDVY